MGTTPRLSPDYDPILAQLAAAPPIPTLSVESARAMWDMMDFGDAEPLAEVSDLSVSGSDGAIPARLYRPDGTPMALVVYFHGGGWVLGGLKSHDKALRGLAQRSGCAILSIDYRLAPEHPFPAGLDDAIAATRWAAANIGALDCGGARLVVAGDSAGGNLAAAVAIAARDGGGPAIAGQLLIYPVADAACDSASYAERGNGGLLSAADMAWFWSHYAPDTASRADPRASINCTASLAGLPPAVVVTAEFDPLRDEGRRFADRLKLEGTPVNFLHFADQPHGFITFYQVAPSALAAMDRIATALRDLVSVA